MHRAERAESSGTCVVLYCKCAHIIIVAKQYILVDKVHAIFLPRPENHVILVLIVDSHGCPPWSVLWQDIYTSRVYSEYILFRLDTDAQTHTHAHAKSYYYYYRVAVRFIGQPDTWPPGVMICHHLIQ